MSNIWKILDIEPTNDTRVIKKAYAAHVKNCHQEDEPERWQELYEAYKQALSVAEGRRVTVSASRAQHTKRASDLQTKKASSPEKEGVLPKQERQKQEASLKEEPKEVPKEVRKVKLKFEEETKAKQTAEEITRTVEGRNEEEHDKYEELFEKIGRAQRLEASRAHHLENLYKMLALPPEKHSATFEKFLNHAKSPVVFKELAFWQAMTDFLRKASTTSETYECISKKISELLNDEERTFSEEVVAEMQTAQTLCQVKGRETKHREKNASAEGKKAFKSDIRQRILQILGLIILMVFLLLLFGDGSPEDWGRFIIRLLRTIVRIL